MWCSSVAVDRQVGQGEIRVLQDETMDPLVLGAFFMHPDQGLSIAKEYVQVCNIFQTHKQFLPKINRYWFLNNKSY